MALISKSCPSGRVDTHHHVTMLLVGPGAAKADHFSLDNLWSGSAESSHRLGTIGLNLDGRPVLARSGSL